ncbi:ABC-ATPase domain-containing protein [Oculatella sp. LEGE 06141]|uniref:ABC-ATPase domain-containing protein n=1 Tax=Oculatella sp. LEGE 06141 TaxID=1828648 RepID=UPI00187F5ED3|nr:ABC-ATPase domain-containing protein [Oculatella sp. LEGE 06141]MBE9182320.1 ABC-ATPase domain-containing protein [Oculatella sp. LEGE 06141]
MSNSHPLNQQLLQLDQRGYKAYQQIRGHHQFDTFTLIIDRIQADPFASPSRLRVLVPQTVANFPALLYRTPIRAIALRDYLNRQFAQVALSLQEKRGSGNSGLIAIAHPGQHVLDRSSVWINDDQVEVRFGVGLPAQGRTILGQQAVALLCNNLPHIIDRALLYSRLDATAIQQHVETVEDAEWLRQQLAHRGLVSFIADGSILPRQSGVSDEPLTQQALPFASPESLRVAFERPNQGRITGMGIPAGITLIVGGGYHGKSTLLQAIALGIYNHRPGDGRETVVTDAKAVNIRAEDGRSITGVDISPFINHLPQNRSTLQFSSGNASGSTSQAANIIEALEAGATTLLVDEDTSATNFMIRDRRMQALIAKDKEPITPFIDKIQALYGDYGVSTILVMGGSGDYFDVADTLIAMTDFAPQEVTAQARAIAHQFATARTPEGGEQFGSLRDRTLVSHRLEDRMTDRRSRLKVRDTDELVLDREAIDVTAVEQLVEVGQLRAIGMAIVQIQQEYLDGHHTMRDLLERLMTTIAQAGLDGLTVERQGDLAMFRSLELAAVLNRMRSIAVR